MRQCINYSETSRKPMIRLGGGVFCNIVIVFGIPRKLVSLIECVRMKPVAYFG